MQPFSLIFRKPLLVFLGLFLWLHVGVAGQNYFHSISLNQPDVHLRPEPPAKKAWSRAYVQKLLLVSPRTNFGVGTFHTQMTYFVPDLGAFVEDAARDLKGTFPWVPWNEVQVDVGNVNRTRSLRKPWTFYGTVGVNLPFVFIDLEAGAGRFSQPFLMVEDVMPPWRLFGLDALIDLVGKRIATPGEKGSLTLRLGAELERLLPDPYLPRLRLGGMEAGLDLQGYFLLGADLSYRTGLEVVEPRALARLAEVLDPVPLVPQNIKSDAAEAILKHVEAALPTYFWAPIFKGWGLGAEAYLDLNGRLRVHGSFQLEQARGLKVEGADWLQAGPSMYRTFFTIGVTAPL